MEAMIIMPTPQDREGSILEELMEFVICPLCKEGRLLPFSSNNGPFHCWVCSAPNCTYVVSSGFMEVKYYKGTAAAKVTEKDGKKYIEFKF
jgi:ssDNA-binding Zn-finger/Zn-ribbon topoisomerase 1